MGREKNECGIERKVEGSQKVRVLAAWVSSKKTAACSSQSSHNAERESEVVVEQDVVRADVLV